MHEVSTQTPPVHFWGACINVITTYCIFSNLIHTRI